MESANFRLELKLSDEKFGQWLDKVEGLLDGVGLGAGKKISDNVFVGADGTRAGKKIAKEIADEGNNAGVGFGKLFGAGLLANLATSGIQTAISGIFNNLGNGFNAFVGFEDSMAGVTKTAGLTKSEVGDLSKEILNLAPTTRSSIDELVTLAQIGGQFGVPKQELAGFTDEVNKVNVALGDEFSGGAEEVAAKLTTIKGLFRETDAQSYSDAMKSVGSSLNELGADGTATAPVVAEFTTRIGQLGPELAPTITQTLGLGAAFQEMGLSAEVSSGGLTNIMLTAGQQTEAYAKQIGITEEAFIDLLNSDPNEMILQLAESFKGLSNTEIAERMKDLKLGSQESIKVMSLLSNQTDTVRQKQELAAKAFAEGTSIGAEYDKVNNTTAANLAKAGNLIQATAIKIGNSFKTAFENNPALQRFSQKIMEVAQEVGKINFQPLADNIGNVIGLAVDALTFLVHHSDITIAALSGIGAGITASLLPALQALATTMMTTTLPALLASATAAAPFIALGLAVAAVVYAFQNWDTIVATVSQKWGEFTSFLSTEWAKTSDLLNNKWNEMVNNLSKKSAEVSTGVSKAFNDAKAAISGFYNANKPLLDSIFVGLTTYIYLKVVPALLQFGMTLAANVSQAVIGFSTTLMTQTIPAIVSFSTTLLTQTIPNLVRMGVAFLVNGAQSVMSFTSTLLTQGVTALVTFGTTLMTQTIPNLTAMAGSFIATAIPAAMTFVSTLFAGVIPALATMGTAMWAALGPIGAIAIAVGVLALAWNTNFLGIRDIVTNTAKWIGDRFNEIGEALKGAKNPLDFLRNLWNSNFLGIKDITTQVVTYIVTWVIQKFIEWKAAWGVLINAIKATWDQFWAGVRDTAVTIAAAIVVSMVQFVTGVGDRFNQAGEMIKNAWTSAWDFVKSINVAQIATDLLNGFIKGIQDGAMGVINAMRDMANSAMQAAKDALQIKSPSRKMMKVGSFVGEGMVIGIKDSTKNVAKAALAMANSVINSATGGLGTASFGFNPLLAAQVPGQTPAPISGAAPQPPMGTAMPPQTAQPAPEDRMSKVMDTANEGMDKQNSSVDQMVNNISEKLPAAYDTATEKIKGALTNMETVVVEMANKMNENFINIFTGIGGNIPTGIVFGMAQKERGAYEAVASLQDNVLRAVGAEIESRKQYGEAGRGAANGVPNVVSAIGEFIKDFKPSTGSNTTNKSVNIGSVQVNNSSEGNALGQMANAFL